jgi:hypothetical protein
LFGEFFTLEQLFESRRRPKLQHHFGLVQAEKEIHPIPIASRDNGGTSDLEGGVQRPHVERNVNPVGGGVFAEPGLGVIQNAISLGELAANRLAELHVIFVAVDDFHHFLASIAPTVRSAAMMMNAMFAKNIGIATVIGVYTNLLYGRVV